MVINSYKYNYINSIIHSVHSYLINNYYFNFQLKSFSESFDIFKYYNFDLLK